MLELVLGLRASVSVALRSRRTLVLENLALRHHLGVLTRSARRRPGLQLYDRLLWIVLRRLWADWKRALVLVQPAADVRAEWLRGAEVTGITAGTSTPDSVIDDIETLVRRSRSGEAAA